MVRTARHGRLGWSGRGALAAVALLLALGVTVPAALASGAEEVRLRADLAGDPIEDVTPRGEARFRQDSDGERRFRTTVQDVNLPGGTELGVAVAGTAVGVIVLDDNNDGELRLRTEDGDDVSLAGEGDEVTVTTSDGAVILSGVFQAD